MYILVQNQTIGAKPVILYTWGGQDLALIDQARCPHRQSRQMVCNRANVFLSLERGKHHVPVPVFMINDNDNQFKFPSSRGCGMCLKKLRRQPDGQASRPKTIPKKGTNSWGTTFHMRQAAIWPQSLTCDSMAWLELPWDQKLGSMGSGFEIIWNCAPEKKIVHELSPCPWSWFMVCHRFPP